MDPDVLLFLDMAEHMLADRAEIHTPAVTQAIEDLLLARASAWAKLAELQAELFGSTCDG